MTDLVLDPADAALEVLEQQDEREDGFNENPPSDIVAYNELRSCADLFRMSEEGSLIIQPEFQRDFIWKGVDQTRFIDSLVKQLPVPSMCFAMDYKRNEWIVIDGLQRISTIIRFLRGEDWTLSTLSDIDPSLRGRNAAALKTSRSGEQRTIYSRVQNQSLPINILRCDLSKKSHNEYIYTIFHRLNSGGLKLNNQEIRNCIFTGTLNSLLRELDQRPSWRRINHMRPDQNYRFTKQEQMLRFFAFFDQQEDYRGSIAKFLNEYMFDNRRTAETWLAAKREIFSRTVDLISAHIFVTDPLPRYPATVLEATMIGIAHNLDTAEQKTPAELQASFNKLRSHQSLSAEFLAEGLSKPDRVNSRLNAAVEAFR
jgi:hypothetical protein